MYLYIYIKIDISGKIKSSAGLILIYRVVQNRISVRLYDISH